MTRIERVVEGIKAQKTEAQLSQVEAHKCAYFVTEDYWMAYEDALTWVLNMIEADHRAELLTKGKEAPF